LNNQENWEKLIYLYQGNPLYLKLVATLLNQLFNSQITISQTENCLLSEELQMILNTQIGRLSPLEKEILTYLAINDNQYSLNQLLDIFNLPKNQIINTFQSLMRRTLIEQNSATSEIENNYTVAPLSTGQKM
jgi:predicted ATPase